MSRQMLSAMSGSLSKRYLSALASACGMLSRDIGFSWNSIFASLRSIRRAEHTEQFRDRVEEAIHHPLLQRNNRIIGDRDALRADFGAAFGDVAEPDHEIAPQLRDAVPRVQRMHFQRRRVHQKARAYELSVHLVVPQHVADVLAQVALDTLAELMKTVRVLMG